MTLLFINLSIDSYVRKEGPTSLQEERDFIFMNHIPKPFNTYRGIPERTYLFHNGTSLRLPCANDWLTETSYEVQWMHFITRSRAIILQSPQD